MKILEANSMDQKLKAVLERVLSDDFESLKKMDNFRDSEYWDSLAYVNLVVSLETEFKIKLKREDIQQLFSIPKIKSVLAKYGIQN
jgi:acyl carrier protein